MVGAGEARGWRCEHRPAAAGGGERKTRDGEKRGEGKREERREMRADRWGLTATWVPCHQNCFMAKYVWF